MSNCIFNLDINAIIKERNADRRTPLRIIAVNESINNGFAQNGQRNAPDVFTPHGSEQSAFECMLFYVVTTDLA